MVSDILCCIHCTYTVWDLRAISFISDFFSTAVAAAVGMVCECVSIHFILLSFPLSFGESFRAEFTFVYSNFTISVVFELYLTYLRCDECMNIAT